METVEENSAPQQSIHGKRSALTHTLSVPHSGSCNYLDGLERSNGPKNNLPSLPKLMITSPTSENNDSSECDNLQQVKRGSF